MEKSEIYRELMLRICTIKLTQCDTDHLAEWLEKKSAEAMLCAEAIKDDEHLHLEELITRVSQS